MKSLLLIAVYAFPLGLITWYYLRSRRRREAAHAQAFAEARQAGFTEPASLHPVIDPRVCIGSGGCAKACPEGALGVIDGKAMLVNPTMCIGHGACASACPVEAIKLVFGSARRGVEIPYVTPTFETNVPGIFIAGELGGMGLIRKAAEQGRQAIETIRGRRRDRADLDVVIVGAGPAGLSAGLGAIQHGLKYALIEQESALGGCIYHYPRNKIAMTAPLRLPLIGKVKLGEISKEDLLAFWDRIVRKTGIEIRFGERMEAVDRTEHGFLVKTSRGSYRTGCVLLAIGRRGTPRRLGVPGEDSPQVVYRLVDPEQYDGQNVLVVGGGDSALEAALALAARPRVKVSLSYRGDAFGRVKEKNRLRLEEARRAGQVDVILNSKVVRIDHDGVLLDQEGRRIALRNDAVIVSAGGDLPTDLLKSIGIAFETKHGTA